MFQQAPLYRQVLLSIKYTLLSRCRQKLFVLECVLPFVFLTFVCIFANKGEYITILPDNTEEDSTLSVSSLMTSTDEPKIAYISEYNSTYFQYMQWIFNTYLNTANPIYMTSDAEFSDYVAKNLETSHTFFGLQENKDLSGSSIDLTVLSSGPTGYSVPYLIGNISTAILSLKKIALSGQFKIINVSYSFTKYPVNRLLDYYNLYGLATTCFAIAFAISGILCTSTYYGLECETGLRDFLFFYGLSDLAFHIRWYIIAFIVMFIPAIMFIIAITIICKANFFFVFLTFLFSLTALTSFSMMLVALYPKEKVGQPVGFGILLSFFIFIFWGFFAFITIEGHWPEKIIISIFPHAAMGYSLYHIIARNSVTFSELNNQNYYPLYIGWIYLIAETVVYLLLYILIDYVKSRTWFPARRKWHKMSGKHAEGQNVISVKNLVKRYNADVLALSGISFEVNQGETLAIIGPNGAGKSTTMSLLCGCMEATSGEIFFNGVDILKDIRTMHRMVGLCPQSNICMNDLTPDEWLRFLCNLRNLGDYDFSSIIKALGLTDQMGYRISNLSGGNKRKVCLAAALICDPQIVLLDEATAGVDFTSRTRIWSIISSLKSTTVIMATHTLEECEKIADRVLILEYGRISHHETPNRLHEIYKCGYQIDANVLYKDELKHILEQNGVTADLNIVDDQVLCTIPSSDPQLITNILHNIKFKYLLSIQSLEEKIFSQMQTGYNNIDMEEKEVELYPERNLDI